jgi:simple sugar transport system substrate-binding protein
LDVAAFYDGHVAEGEGWTWGHDDALHKVVTDLGYARLRTKEGVNSTTLMPPMEEAIARGADVVVATSLALEGPVVEAAKRHPNVHFLIATASTWLARPNLTTYQGRSEAAYHVGGMVAAQKATKRIGMILTTPHPRVFSEANAFALGALRQRPDLKIEARWLGFFIDYNTVPTFPHGDKTLFLEELLTERLMASGCEVIALFDDTARSTRYIESRLTPTETPLVFSLPRNDKAACRDRVTGQLMRSCLGSVFYDWAPRYAEMLDGLHRHTWVGQGVIDYMNTSSRSVIGVDLNPLVGLDDTSIRVAVNEFSGPDGNDRVFRGPYEITGQRDADGDGKPDAAQRVSEGEIVSSQELSRMCWFVKGVVQKQDPEDPSSPDVDALAPDGSFPPPKDFISPPGMAADQVFDCRAYQ